MLYVIATLVIVLLSLFAVNNWVSGHKVDHISDTTDNVNTAVNHAEHGMPTLVQRVIDQDEHGLALASDLAVFREWVTTSIQAIADYQDIQLPEQPAKIKVVELPIIPVDSGS